MRSFWFQSFRCFLLWALGSPLWAILFCQCAQLSDMHVSPWVVYRYFIGSILKNVEPHPQKAIWKHNINRNLEVGWLMKKSVEILDDLTMWFLISGLPMLAASNLEVCLRDKPWFPAMGIILSYDLACQGPGDNYWPKNMKALCLSQRWSSMSNAIMHKQFEYFLEGVHEDLSHWRLIVLLNSVQKQSYDISVPTKMVLPKYRYLHVNKTL